MSEEEYRINMNQLNVISLWFRKLLGVDIQNKNI